MTRYLLDTNIISYMVRDHFQAALLRKHLLFVREAACISVVTEAELLFGIARRPKAARLAKAIAQLIQTVEVLPWTSREAGIYGMLRARLETSGQSLAALDLFIAAQALAEDATLVTNDAAFRQVPNLRVENWATDF